MLIAAGTSCFAFLAFVGVAISLRRPPAGCPALYPYRTGLPTQPLLALLYPGPQSSRYRTLSPPQLLVRHELESVFVSDYCIATKPEHPA